MISNGITKHLSTSMLTKKLSWQTMPSLVRWMAAVTRPFPVIQDPLDLDCPQLAESKQKAEEQIAQLKQLNKVALSGGGERGIALHVKINKKMLVRDKLKLLLDDDADFMELSLLAGLGMEYGDVPAAGAICGIGKVHGKYCVVAANDGSVKSGTFYPITVTKNLRTQNIGAMNRLPCIYLVDSAGGFLPLQSDLFADKNHGGRGFYNPPVMSAAGVPQLALVCGSCTAGGAYQPSMCEDAAIVTRIGTIFLGGPPLVKAATGEEITAEDLGGARVHCSVSGVTDYFAATEEEGFEILRDTVATLNVPPISAAPPEAQDPDLSADVLNAMSALDVIDRSKMYGVIARIVDGGRFREFKQQYGKNLITGYAFIEGRCVGIIGNAGPLTYEDGLKGSHFTQICQQRQLPIVFLQNSGPLKAYQAQMASMSAEEVNQAMKGRATMMAAISCVTVPKITVNVGSCHGDDNYTMCGPSFSPNFIFSWPSAMVTHTLNPAPVPPQPKPAPEGEKKEPAKKRKPLSAFNFPVGSSFYQASRIIIDGVIVPSETRKVVAQCLRICRQQEKMQNSSKDFPVFRL